MKRCKKQTLKQIGCHDRNTILTEEFKRANDSIVNMLHTEVSDWDHVKTLTCIIAEFNKWSGMIEVKLYKAINGTWSNNPTMTTEKPKTNKSIMWSYYWRPDGTHIGYLLGYCWSCEFLVKKYHKRKTCNATFLNKVHQEIATCDNNMGVSTWGQPRKWWYKGGYYKVQVIKV